MLSPKERRRWFGVLACTLAFAAGCASPPRRSDTVVSNYAPLMGQEVTAAAPLASRWGDLAEDAFRRSAPESPVHYVVPLEIGDDALAARVHLARAARNTIEVQTFIWHDDPTSRLMFDELAAAARRGVRVRVLADALTPMGEPPVLATMAQMHRNIEVRVYKPFSSEAVTKTRDYADSLVFKFQRLNRRMHNKIFVVDGQIGIVGGRNYQTKYFDRDPAFNFKDRDVLVAGPCVTNMVGWFDTYWAADRSVPLLQFRDVQADLSESGPASEQLLDARGRERFAALLADAGVRDLATRRPGLQAYAVGRVDYVSDHPKKSWGRRVRGLHDASWQLEALIKTSQEGIVMQTPYLIYQRATRRFMKRMRKRNPDFKVRASSNSLAAADHLAVYAISYKHRKQLFKSAGIDIYEFRPVPDDMVAMMPRYPTLLEDEGLYTPDEDLEASQIVAITRKGPRFCVHAKTFVLDSKIVYIGSHNFDPRSTKYNTECGVVIHDEAFARHIESQIERDMAPGNSWVVNRMRVIPWYARISRPIATLSSWLPVFDVWPFRYTTNFALKDGRDPLPPRAPGFYEAYRDVGQFPEVDSNTQTVQTMLIKAFGGWAAPLM